MAVPMSSTTWLGILMGMLLSTLYMYDRRYSDTSIIAVAVFGAAMMVITLLVAYLVQAAS